MKKKVYLLVLKQRKIKKKKKIVSNSLNRYGLLWFLKIESKISRKLGKVGLFI
jgi:hypothetical protein